MYWRLVGSTLVAIHDEWALASPRRRRSWWYAFASPRRRHPFVDVVGCCPSRTTVRRAFVSVKLFGVTALHLELGDVEGAGRPHVFDRENDQIYTSVTHCQLTISLANSRYIT